MARFAFLTPPAPTGVGGVFYCRYGSADISALIFGALAVLGQDDAWEQLDPANMSPEEAAQYFRNLSYEAFGTMNFLVGALLPYMTAVAPSCALPCDGSTYSRVDYPLLYAALPAAFIVDADNFTVPDLSGRFPIGIDATNGIDLADTGGNDEVTLSVDNLPSHNHSYTPPVLNLDLETPGAPDVFAAGIGLTTTTGSTGGDQPFSILNPFVAVRWGIVHGQ